MKPAVPPSIEPLEPRLLLSVCLQMLEPPTDSPSPSEGGIVVEQAPPAGILSSGGSLFVSSGGVVDSMVLLEGAGSDTMWIGPWAEGYWTSYTPTAEQTSLSILRDEATTTIKVTLTFATSGYRVLDWGTLERQGDTFIVNVQTEELKDGIVSPALTAISHEYDLGELPAGDYTFEFRASDQFVKSKWFLAEPRQWLPFVPAAGQTGISILRDEAATGVRVTIEFGDSGYRMRSWGAVQREGDTFIINVQPEKLHGAIVLTVITPVTHEYDLGPLPEGDYTIELRAWDQVVMSTAFGPADVMEPVYRFWSPILLRHFYTIDEAERDKLIDSYSDVWAFEGTAYYAFAGDAQPDAAPVYRFWSSAFNSHFYTIDEDEKASMIDDYADLWTYEGVAFYAYAGDPRPLGMQMVYRFWSERSNSQFFTTDDEEARKLWSEWSSVWIPDGIAWYACGV